MQPGVTSSSRPRAPRLPRRWPRCGWRALKAQSPRASTCATLSSLPPDYRRVLLAKYVDERSVTEIAGNVKRGEKATESLLHRARVAFARVFELLAKKRGELP